MPLLAQNGKATGDPQIIGEHAWKLLQSFAFDAKEVRGVGIQIQKLETVSGPATAAGQARLPFKSNIPKPAAHVPDIQIQPPSSLAKPVAASNSEMALPSLSQVDMDVFNALPEELRQELQSEYKRRSESPALAQLDQPQRSRSTTPLENAGKKKIPMRNFKGIAKQFGARNRPSISPQKNSLFGQRNALFAPGSTVRVGDDQLRELGIDPDVFRFLPANLQREQLSLSRFVKEKGVDALAEFAKIEKKKPVQRRSRSISKKRHRGPPPPQANHPQAPTLKQQGKVKGEKLHFTETDDVQRVIEAWVDSFTRSPPNQRDVDYFAKFLVQSVDGLRFTDAGLEKAIAVAKWWQILLRRKWGLWENADLEEVVDAKSEEGVGRAWWKAFREVKSKMDVVARARFGGCLSLR